MVGAIELTFKSQMWIWSTVPKNEAHVSVMPVYIVNIYFRIETMHVLLIKARFLPFSGWSAFFH